MSCSGFRKQTKLEFASAADCKFLPWLTHGPCRNFKSKAAREPRVAGALCFRSSCQRVRRGITKFASGGASRRSRGPYLQLRSRSMRSSFRQIINKAVKDKRMLVVPAAHDALSARLIQKVGFETYFIGGFPAIGSRYGVPDVGLKGIGEMSAAVRDIMSACDLPVFVDGDDGYGDVKNVVHTVRTYERMG